MGDSRNIIRILPDASVPGSKQTTIILDILSVEERCPQKVRMKYESMRTDENNDQIDRFIRISDLALTHPDDLDVEQQKSIRRSYVKERFNYNEIMYTRRLPPGSFFLVFFDKNTRK